METHNSGELEKYFSFAQGEKKLLNHTDSLGSFKHVYTLKIVEYHALLF